ncbi:hypothetical protein FB45DRAFT_1102841 [Roridomyces roridus]|uniref:DUF6534 domain-containing protein n=1 Tax=Roridomyces roridus TaxID=1738132 RepID=A0AAD7CIW2_9AGAR|nr:hypothetical protein FB45DRAFT_1102841 [Roridomyces roridus]
MGQYDTTLGAMSVGYVLAWGLYGVLSTQAFSYFQKFPKDNKWLKLLVSSLWLLDTVQLALIGQMLYDWLVINYGNPASFQVNSIWTFSRDSVNGDLKPIFMVQFVGLTHVLKNLIILIVEFILFVQVSLGLGINRWYFVVSDGNWILCSVIILLSLFFFVFELAAVVRMFQLQELALFYKFQWTSSAGLACASMADVLIAVSLCWYLMKTRTGLQTKTDSIVTRLILYAINTGLLTSVVVLMDMICFLTMPDNLIHLSFNIMVGKLYSNSLLATLNFRNSVRKRNKDGITTFSFSNRSRQQVSFCLLLDEFDEGDGCRRGYFAIVSKSIADEGRRRATVFFASGEPLKQESTTKGGPFKDSVLQALARSEATGSWKKRDALTDAPVHKELQQGTQNNYRHALEMWDAFITTLNDSWVKDPNDYRTAKAFASFIATGIPGKEHGSKPSQTSVVQCWKNLTAGWKWDRRGHIDPEVKTSTRNYIQGELQRELELPLRKRVRRFAAVPHFIRLGTQLWANDWATFGRSGDRVDFWAELQLYAFTSGRVGEYIESTARAGSGRGLRYRDVSFSIFRNEYGDAEFALQVVKDAKGMTFMPCKRPEHSLHEGLEERPLFCNPILTHLAMFIAKGAFRDYKTMEELLALEPPDDEEMYLLRWEPEVYDRPIYQRKDGKMESASTFSNRLRSLAHRAGYPNPPTIHDFRAEGLFRIGNFYSPSQRMRQAGHRDDRTYTEYYAPTNPGTDGQGSYFGGTRRTLVNERFRALTVAWNPELYQSLSAEKMYELQNRDDFAALDEQLLELCLQRDSSDSAEKRKQLQAQKRQLIADELRRLQSDQPRNITKSAPDSQVGHQRTMFSRIRHLMGPRDRLAHNLLLTAPIRSDVGRAVLSDLVTLYSQRSEVEARRGLEPERCCCASKIGKATKSSPKDLKHSRHVYGCVKKRLQAKGSCSEFCFLCKAGPWFDDAAEWEKHCQFHLNSQLPTQCNPFSYDKCIASPGFCPFCLGDERLDATTRMRHFVEARQWREHVESHISELGAHVSMHKGPPLPLRCPHPRPQCKEETFDSVQRLVFHLQDVHCWIRHTSRPRKSGLGCLPTAPDDVDEDEYDEVEYDDAPEAIDKESECIPTPDFRPRSPCAIASPSSSCASSSSASSSSASWSDDQSQCKVFVSASSYPPTNPAQDVPVGDEMYYPSGVAGAWIGDFHGSYPPADHYASFPSMAHLPSYLNEELLDYGCGWVTQAASSSTPGWPDATPGYAASGYDYAGDTTAYFARVKSGYLAVLVRTPMPLSGDIQ